MKLINKGTNPLAHGDYKLPKGGVADIPDDIAQYWLEIPGIKQYVSTEDLAEANQKADTEKKALQDEIAKLKAELEEAKKPKADTEEKAEDKPANNNKKGNK